MCSINCCKDCICEFHYLGFKINSGDEKMISIFYMSDNIWYLNPRSLIDGKPKPPPQRTSPNDLAMEDEIYYFYITDGKPQSQSKMMKNK